MTRRRRVAVALCLPASLGLLCSAAEAQTVWTGPTITFTKENYADWTLQQNQDRITDNVWITRADIGGIFNINLEAGFDFGSFSSPADTEWAFGSAEDWQNLEFQTWYDWHGGSPPSVLNDPAVVHLITDDIYIDIEFLSWTSGMGQGGGGFSYARSTLPAPPSLALLAALGLVPGPRQRRRE